AGLAAARGACLARVRQRSVGASAGDAVHLPALLVALAGGADRERLLAATALARALALAVDVVEAGLAGARCKHVDRGAAEEALALWRAAAAEVDRRETLAAEIAGALERRTAFGVRGAGAADEPVAGFRKRERGGTDPIAAVGRRGHGLDAG